MTWPLEINLSKKLNVVGGSIPNCEISSLLDKNLALVCRPFLSSSLVGNNPTIIFFLFFLLKKNLNLAGAPVGFAVKMSGEVLGLIGVKSLASFQVHRLHFEIFWGLIFY